MKQYSITVLTKGVEIVVTFDNQERLIGFQITGDITDIFYDWLIQHLPLKEKSLSIFKPIKNVKVAEIMEDLTFARFWDEYDHKMSAKKNTNAIWNKLSDSDKSNAILHIKKYDRYLFENPGVTKKMANTYLNTALWNN